jgi:hypothetical protein
VEREHDGSETQLDAVTLLGRLGFPLGATDPVLLQASYEDGLRFSLKLRDVLHPDIEPLTIPRIDPASSRSGKRPK